MKLILCDINWGSPLKRWAKLYGCDSGWNLAKTSVYEILNLDDDDPTLLDVWSDFLTNTRYRIGGEVHKLCVHDNDLYLHRV